jgi:predicted ATPase
MAELDFTKKIDPDKLKKLDARAARALTTLRSGRAKKPYFVEVAGCPKSGKSTCIDIVSHFLKRTDFKVLAPVEGASKRTPHALKYDLVAFNTWSACYALQKILTGICSQDDYDIVFLDRGLFDAANWMNFLVSDDKLSSKEQHLIEDFLLMQRWCERINVVFLFQCAPETSMNREYASKLTRRKGSAMNPDTLENILRSYKEVSDRLSDRFRKFIEIDTSDEKVHFLNIAYKMVHDVFDDIEKLSNT